MKHQFFNSVLTALPSSPNNQPSTEQPTMHTGNRRKIYAALAIALAAIIIVAAVFFVPQSSANTISLGVHYTQGEKLTYDVTTSASSNANSTSVNLSQNSILTVEVVSIQGDTYTLNYTMTTNAIGSSVAISKMINVQESQMVTTLALLPVALQVAAAAGNDTTPLMTAVFDQSTAKVGDTWTIPITNSGGSTADNLTVTFKAIQDLSVPAGNYHVFSIGYSTGVQANQDLLDMNVQLSGESYLETGSCKQVQSNLLVTLSLSSRLASSVSLNLALTISTLFGKRR